jgi:hypothetical protein
MAPVIVSADAMPVTMAHLHIRARADNRAADGVLCAGGHSDNASAANAATKIALRTKCLHYLFACVENPAKGFVP